MRSEQSSHSPLNRQPLLPAVPNPPVPHSNPISSRPSPSEGDQAQPPLWRDARPGRAPTPARLAHCLSQRGAIASPSNVPASPAASARPRPLCDAGLRTPPNTSTCEPLFLASLFAKVMCVCYFYVHLLYVLVNVVFPLVHTRQSGNLLSMAQKDDEKKLTRFVWESVSHLLF